MCTCLPECAHGGPRPGAAPAHTEASREGAVRPVLFSCSFEAESLPEPGALIVSGIPEARKPQ